MRQNPEDKNLFEGPGEIQGDAEPAPVNPIAQFHDLMRGRYRLTIILLLLGLCVGGTVGYFSSPLVYQSTGMIRIQPNLPRVLYENEQNGVMPMFDAFVQSQMALIQSERVVAMAMQDPAWVALGRGLDPAGVADFQRNLLVERPDRSELILVEFQDRDATAARIGVQVVVEAYDHIYGDTENNGVTTSVRVLEERRSKLEAEQRSWNEKIASIASDAGGSKELLDRMLDAKIAQVNEVETQLRQTQLAASVALRVASANSKPGAPPAATVDQRFAAQTLQSLDATKERLELEIASNEGVLGEQHPKMIADKKTLALIDRQIQQAEASFESGNPTDASRWSASDHGKSAAELKAEEKSLSDLFDQLHGEMLELTHRCADVGHNKAEADKVASQLDQTNQRIEQLDLESSVGGRVIVENKGDQPQVPFRNKRRQMAAAGGLGLALAGVAFVALLGFMDRRVRGLSDVTMVAGRSERILGVLPFLPDDLNDPDQVMMAAQSVHQIRAMLEQSQAAARPVFAVTSASPGSGKTSLALALGLSFAASGSKVLLMDCDIIGGGLTARMKQIRHRRLGRILCSQKIVNMPQIRTAMKEARRTGERLGEVLLRLKYVSAAELDYALRAQQDTNIGLREAMGGEHAINCIAQTGVPGLFLMPLGTADRRHVGQLSYNIVRRILEQVRDRFDVILIDTGPILGSLEAGLVAMAADEVVLMVARGEQRPLVERAKQQLAASGGRLAGIVLNRAEAVDIVMSGLSSSVARLSNDVSSRPQLALAPVGNDHLQLGPIGSAVASLTDVSARVPRDVRRINSR